MEKKKINIRPDAHIEFEGGEGIYNPKTNSMIIVQGNRHYNIKKNADYYDPKEGFSKLKNYSSGGIVLPIKDLENNIIIPRKMILTKDKDNNFIRAMAFNNTNKINNLLDRLINQQNERKSK